MLSKITIHTAPNYKPCIRVVEPYYHHEADVSSDDVRDALVRGFRELLDHKSNSAEIIFQGSNQEYIIYPIEDELKYIEKLVYKWLDTDNAGRKKLMEISKMIQQNLKDTIFED